MGLTMAMVLAPGRSEAGRFDPYRKLGVFARVLSAIERLYVADVSESTLMYGAARGLTEALDPHTRFMDPEEYAQLRKETEENPEILGVGIDVERRGEDILIVSPIDGSPAAKAGVQPGDIIRKVDDVPVSAATWETAIKRIQGPEGSWVRLELARARRPSTYAFSGPASKCPVSKATWKSPVLAT